MRTEPTSSRRPSSLDVGGDPQDAHAGGHDSPGHDHVYFSISPRMVAMLNDELSQLGVNPLAGGAAELVAWA